MSSQIQRFLRYFHSQEPLHTVMVSGLGYGGDETLPHALRLNPEHVIYTIPTIGVVIETFTITPLNGKKFKVSGWDGGAGCAGFRFIINLLRWYINNEKADALIWVVDSSDRERMKESIKSLDQVLNPPDVVVAQLGRDALEQLNTIPILLLANYWDRPNALTVDEIYKDFGDVTRGHTTSIFKVTMTYGASAGFDEPFTWLSNIFDAPNTSGKSEDVSKAGNNFTPTPNKLPDPRSPDLLATKLESWSQRAKSDLSPEEFIIRFNAVDLPSWDHYTHVRLAFVILTTYGRQKGKNMIFDGITNYIVNSKQTTGRSFHLTMTYFWIQIVHFGLQNMLLFAEKREEKEKQGISPNDFLEYLSLNPYVVDGNLWADYYSTTLMMGSEAKIQMVLPDKKPLPNIAGRDNINNANI